MPGPRLDDVSCLRLSRDSIQKWLSKPQFADVIKGLYCRVVVREKDSQKHYKVARVESIHDINAAEKSATIKVSYGKIVKDFSLDFVSNGSFTPEEFAAYSAVMQKDGVPMVTPGEIDRKIAGIKAFVNATNSKKPAPGAGGRTVSASGRKRPADAPEGAPARQQRRVVPQDKDSLSAMVKARGREVLQEAVKLEKKEGELAQAKKERDESQQLLKEVEQQVKALGDQHAALSRKERQADEMRAVLGRLQSDLAEQKAMCEARANAVRAEQETVRLRLLKMKEMDMLIASQEFFIVQQREVAAAHQRLSKSREEAAELIAARNKLLSRDNKQRKEKLDRLRAELQQLRRAQPTRSPSPAARAPEPEGAAAAEGKHQGGEASANGEGEA
eukprot:TRINITY_DN2477_c0_g1_i4.p1 TRINITY_DN2477_c0_g1~~TRINITY_DN2477_c0_g1_i4.p1  ORF type:complete len:388 (+),score=149.31 TRINITY_DN2477_c0_g1_i4:107-1270(+)